MTARGNRSVPNSLLKNVGRALLPVFPFERRRAKVPVLQGHRLSESGRSSATVTEAVF